MQRVQRRLDATLSHLGPFVRIAHDTEASVVEIGEIKDGVFSPKVRWSLHVITRPPLASPFVAFTETDLGTNQTTKRTFGGGDKMLIVCLQSWAERLVAPHWRARYRREAA